MKKKTVVGIEACLGNLFMNKMKMSAEAGKSSAGGMIAMQSELDEYITMLKDEMEYKYRINLACASDPRRIDNYPHLFQPIEGGYMLMDGAEYRELKDRFFFSMTEEMQSVILEVNKVHKKVKTEGYNS